MVHHPSCSGVVERGSRVLFRIQGASVALGFWSMAADLGEDVRIRLYTDSVAALGIIGRRGLGKVRHLETGYLWLQDLVAKKKIGVAKVKGIENSADLGTKCLRSEDVDKHFRFLRYYKEDGRSTVAPSI